MPQCWVENSLPTKLSPLHKISCFITATGLKKINKSAFVEVEVFSSLAIDEVGGVPYEILEPVLERCTPEQLYRIEQCNQVCIYTKACSHTHTRKQPKMHDDF